MNSSGEQFSANSFSASISGDGRYITFVTEPGILYLHDRQTLETTEIVSWGMNPVISNDGRFIAFEAPDGNLVNGDTNEALDIFVHDRLTEQTTRISVNDSGAQADSHSLRPSISADGRYITFISYASNLVTGDTNTCWVYTTPGQCPDSFVHDQATRRTIRISVAADGTRANNRTHEFFSSISADGRYAAFISAASNLVNGDTNNVCDTNFDSITTDNCPDVFVVSVSFPSTMTVNTTSDTDDGICDSEHCSLREAINFANTTLGTDTIVFNIPGPGPHTIQPTSVLPPITESVVIDGTTEPDFTGTPIIELDGQQIVSAVSGLTLSSSNSIVRGLVINHFGQSGIRLLGSGNNTVEGNYIGTDVTGTQRRDNFIGILIDESQNNIIGGLTPEQRNLISGNDTYGIYFHLSATSGNVVIGNYIGTDVTGTLPLGNNFGGIQMEDGGDNNRIGGINNGQQNVIAYNGGPGIRLYGDNATRNAILSNSIHSNSDLGIDLVSSVTPVSPNDPGDADTGPNNLQNFPVLTSVNSIGGSTVISGTLNSTANTAFRLEFFSNTACDPSGYGEGQTFLGFVTTTTNGGGDASFTASFPFNILAGTPITATATDLNNNTSEFSQCFTSTSISADLSVTQTDAPDPVIINNHVTYTITVTNNGPDDATGVTLVDVLPANTTFVSATHSGGDCQRDDNLVTCSLGNIANGGNATVTVVVIPTAAGGINNQASAGASEADPNTTNNVNVTTTTVILPPTPTLTPSLTLTPSNTFTPSHTPSPYVPPPTATQTPLPPPPPALTATPFTPTDTPIPTETPTETPIPPVTATNTPPVSPTVTSTPLPSPPPR